MKKTSPKLRLPGKFDPPTGWLLVEMDGFEANTGVILLAATNRPEVLDGARFYQIIGREMPRPKEPVPPLEGAVATASNITERRP